jgi:hypothetical protein
MSELYKAIAGSPITYLSSDISASQTTISIADDSALPDAPNICTIGYGENIETIRYGAKSNGVLQNVTRGIEGTPRAWSAGTEVARFFTAYDHNALIEKFNSHLAESAKLGIYGISASQSIPHNYTESTKIILNKVDRAADFCELVEDGGIKILKTGLYLVTFICAFDHNPSGRRQIGISGTQPIMMQPVSQTNGQTRLSLTYPIYRTSGNIVYVTALQTSGGALNVLSAGTQVMIVKLG